MPTVTQQTVLYPVVLPEPPRFDLTEEDFLVLEGAGQIKFCPEVRRSFQGIAESWIIHDAILRSPRPLHFRQRLKKMEMALVRLMDDLDLNRGDAPILDHHLHNWLINAGIEVVPDFLQKLAVLIHEANEGIELLRQVQSRLPKDEGRRRPRDEDRFVIYLAEQFEAAGGKAVAYSTAHADSGYADTAFRNFAHKFYELLPITRRTTSGLDEALKRALDYRRRHAENG